MSRIPAREAVIASGTVSAVVSLCIVGAIAASASAAPETGHSLSAHNESHGLSATPPYSAIASDASDEPGDRSLVAGSYRGVWFSLPAGGASGSTADFSLSDALGGPASSPASSGSAVSAAASPANPAAGPRTPQPTTAAPGAAPAMREQSRSSVEAAISGGSPRDIARALAATYSWTGAQWTCLDKLWNHESKYETTVRNPASGAYGIPQALPASKMGAAGADWRTNPVTQIVWGLGYIQDRYGSPCGAWSYWLRHSSY